MAHKTLINGTGYEISGGKTLVSGTSYSVKNGKVLTGGTEYDISFLLPANVLDLFEDSNVDANWNIKDKINCIAYGNGYWVVGGQAYNGTNCCARIAYAKSLSGPWSIKDLWKNSKSTYANASISCVAYGNGYWVVGGSGFSSYTFAAISYATSPDSTWTNKTMVNGKYGAVSISCLTYANGYWAVGYGDSDDDGYYYGYIIYATTPNSTWTTKTLYTTSNPQILRTITYGNGYWVVGVVLNGGTQYIKIYYSTALDVTWSNKSVMSSNYDLSLANIIYSNNYWMLCGRKRTSNTTFNAVIAYATTPNSTWTTKTLWSGDSNTMINDITYGNGYWVAVGKYGDGSSVYYSSIAWAEQPDATWTKKGPVWNSNSSQNSINCITFSDNYFVLGGTAYLNSLFKARIAYAGTPAELGNTE